MNISGEGQGKRRSYAHVGMSSESLEAEIQRLRAWVRPVHGEVWITRHDALPALESRSIDEYMLDSKIHDQWERKKNIKYDKLIHLRSRDLAERGRGNFPQVVASTAATPIPMIRAVVRWAARRI